VLCLAAACSREPRRPEFPQLSGHEPFPGITALHMLAEQPQRRVPLPAGFAGVLPCEDGWQWGMNGSSFVAIHRAPGAETGLDVVFVVEQSQPMGAPLRKTAAETAAALIKRLPTSARVGVVTFGGEEGERRALQDTGLREQLVGMLKSARVIEGSSVAAGLAAAEELLPATGDRARSVVVVASAQAGTRGARAVASRLGGAGTSVSVVALGKGAALSEVAEAGQGQFELVGEGAAAGSVGACVGTGRPGTGPVDAWVVASKLTGGGARLPATMSQFRFLARVEPTLTGTAGLEDAALRLVKDQLDPLGVMPEGTWSRAADGLAQGAGEGASVTKRAGEALAQGLAQGAAGGADAAKAVGDALAEKVAGGADAAKGAGEALAQKVAEGADAAKLAGGLAAGGVDAAKAVGEAVAQGVAGSAAGAVDAAGQALAQGAEKGADVAKAAGEALADGVAGSAAGAANAAGKAVAAGADVANAAAAALGGERAGEGQGEDVAPRREVRVGVSGVGQDSDHGDWTGWRWMGANRHGARWRLGAMTGTYRRSLVSSAAAVVGKTLEEGTPTRLVVGYLGDGRDDERGLGVVMVCTRPECPAARAFAELVSQARPPDRGRAELESGGESIQELAFQAGFLWLR
jgi:hypothetical protein